MQNISYLMYIEILESSVVGFYAGLKIKRETKEIL